MVAGAAGCVVEAEGPAGYDEGDAVFEKIGQSEDLEDT